MVQLDHTSDQPLRLPLPHIAVDVAECNPNNQDGRIKYMNKQMWTQCESTFNIERHLLVFLQKSAFYAYISRQLRKIPTLDMPTAAVTFNPETDELCLWYNPIFFGGGSYEVKTKDGGTETITHKPMSNMEVGGVLQHEFDHLVNGHLAARRPGDAQLAQIWNIATDLAINSLIHYNAGTRSEDDALDARPLPRCALIPGLRPYINPDHVATATPEQLKSMNELGDIIEKFPKDQASEFYFNRLVDYAEKKKQKGKGKPGEGDPLGGMDSMDDHGGWDEIPEDQREYIEGKVKSIVEKAVQAADSQSNGWGSIPAWMQAEIRRSVSNIVNWRAVLRQFIGGLVRGERTSSIKRINRKYPYVHPGTKRGYTARLLIAIDQSGSVDDGQLTSFFNELGTLTKRVTVDILPFDCGADAKDIFAWRKGTNPDVKRTRGGGTDFNAPTNLVNDPIHRGKWDGVLIMTDGECGPPGPSRVKRGWVLSKGHKLLFDIAELQVFLDDAKPMTGAWR